MNNIEKLFFIGDDNHNDVFAKWSDSNQPTHIKSIKCNYGNTQPPIATIELTTTKLKRSPSLKYLFRSIWQETLNDVVSIPSDDINHHLNFEANNIAVKTKRGRANLMLMSENTLKYAQGFYVPVNWEFQFNSMLEISKRIPDGYIMLMYCPVNCGFLVRNLERPIHCWKTNNKMQYGYIQEKLSTYVKLISLMDYK